jgi:HEAT repeat protein
LIGWVEEGTSDTCVLEALVEIDPEGKECVPALIKALGHEDGDVVRVTANCLGLLGPRAKAAAPSLAAALTREFDEAMQDYDDVQATISRALRRIGPDAKPAIPALIRTVRARRMHENNIGGNDRWADCIAATAAAETLGSFGSEARGAIPALMDALRSYEVNCDTRPLQRAAALALGRIRSEAQVAISALRDSFEEHDETGRNHPEAIIALYQLAPDGLQEAERWLLEESPDCWKDRRLLAELEGRAMVLGATGRTSFESDWVTRRHLEQLDFMVSHGPPLETEPLESFEWWFEGIGRLGVAGRLGIPRLKEASNSPSPFVRMWAAEALGRIAPPAK